jgi:hypothetical protein
MQQLACGSADQLERFFSAGEFELQVNNLNIQNYWDVSLAGDLTTQFSHVIAKTW